MYKRDLPNFPGLFDTIARFLATADVPQAQRKRLDAAKRAMDCLLRCMYAPPAKIYPCGGLSKIPKMVIEFKCNRIAYVRPDPVAIAKK
jgi:hypothetical protein